MARGGLLSILILVLLAASPAAAFGSGLQEGADAARTGVADRGPSWGDVAFTIPVPGPPSGSLPVILGDSVYLLRSFREEPERPSEIHRIDVHTATAVRIVVADAASGNALATDGSLLFVAVQGGVQAFPVTGGPVRWKWDIPATDGAKPLTCLRLAVADGRLFASCMVVHPGSAANVPGTRAVIAAIDAAQGATIWSWSPGATEDPRRIPGLPETGPSAKPGINVVVDFALLGTTLVAVMDHFALIEASDPTDANRANFSSNRVTLWGLDAATGKTRWVQDSEEPGRAGVRSRVLGQQLPTASGPRSIARGAPTGGASALYMKLGTDEVAINVATGATVWKLALPNADQVVDDGYVGAAFSDHQHVVLAAQAVHLVDTVGRRIAWTHVLPPEPYQIWETVPAFVAGDLVYAFSSEDDDVGLAILHAIDWARGETRWTLPLAGAASLNPAVASGWIALSRHDANFTLVGTTRASIRVEAAPSTRYPEPGRAFEVDLGSSAPGLHGAPTRFRATWGDGAASEWQSSPVLSHAYREPGPRIARFEAANDAGQSSSVLVEFLVGEPEPTVLSVAFDAEHQERTFFVLGLALTGVGALVGTARARRRRARYERAMRDLERAFDERRADPFAAEAALDEHRAHARSLVAAGRITDAHFGLIDRRFDELRLRVRHLEIDRALRFLPHGLVLDLREMLADGRVSRFEREHFLAALDRDATLTPEQKIAVRERIEAWHGADRGRA